MEREKGQPTSWSELFAASSASAATTATYSSSGVTEEEVSGGSLLQRLLDPTVLQEIFAHPSSVSSSSSSSSSTKVEASLAESLHPMYIEDLPASLTSQRPPPFVTSLPAFDIWDCFQPHFFVPPSHGTALIVGSASYKETVTGIARWMRTLCEQTLNTASSIASRLMGTATLEEELRLKATTFEREHWRSAFRLTSSSSPSKAKEELEEECSLHPFLHDSTGRRAVVLLVEQCGSSSLCDFVLMELLPFLLNVITKEENEEKEMKLHKNDDEEEEEEEEEFPDWLSGLLEAAATNKATIFQMPMAEFTRWMNSTIVCSASSSSSVIRTRVQLELARKYFTAKSEQQDRKE